MVSMRLLLICGTLCCVCLSARDALAAGGSLTLTVQEEATDEPEHGSGEEVPK